MSAAADDGESLYDFAYISEENFVLVVLLTSQGDVQTYCKLANDKPRRSLIRRHSLWSQEVDLVSVCLGPEATFVVFGLADGNVLLTPIKNLMDVPWGGSRWLPEQSSILISLASPGVEECLVAPTCMQCFVTRNPPRPLLVLSNKAGAVLLVDLSTRKCIAELSAPQSIREVEVVQTSDTTDILLTSFTDAQWIIPLENGGRCLTEVLTTCIPSEFKKTEPSSSHLRLCAEGITVLDSVGCFVELHNGLSAVGAVPKKRYKVPPDTWMVHYTSNVLFTVSKQAEVRSAVHFGLNAVRLEFSVVRGACECRPLGFVSLSSRPARLPSCLLINERGLIRVQQSASSPLENVAAEFLFRLPSFSLSSIQQVAKACFIDGSQLQRSVLPTLLSARRGKTLSPSDLSHLLFMAKAVEISMDDLVDLFACYQQEEHLLPELLRVVEADSRSPLRKRVVDLYVRKSEILTAKSSEESCSIADARLNIDNELSTFLSRHADIDSGAKRCAEAELWRSATLLASRQGTSQIDVVRVLIRNGSKQSATAGTSTRSLMITCASNLDWSELTDQEVGVLISLLCEWQASLNSIAHHEICMSVAIKYAPRFPKHCSILYLISAMYIISDKAVWNQESSAVHRSISCGINGSVAITSNGQLVIWGDFTNQQHRPLESTEVNKTSRKTPVEVSSSPKKSHAQQLPHPVHIEGRPRFVCCGAEHILVLTTAGRLFAWGRNRFGQCGVGHCKQVFEPEVVEGNWGPIRELSAGQFHSAILNTKGQLWMFGWGVWGQLGLGGRHIKDCHSPTPVTQLKEPIKAVSCGRVHTVLLTESGTILVAGGGSYGQMGTDEDVRKQYAFRPLPIDANLKFVKIATSFYHSIAITDEGRIFEWGRNPQEVKMRMFVVRRLRMAQLKRMADEEGEEMPSPNMEKPKILLPMDAPRDDLGVREVLHLLDGRVTEAATGLSHSAVVTDQGSLFTWGKGLDYQLGHGNKTERSEPHILFDPRDVKWELVACGGNHTIAVSKDGRTFGWGRNDFAQCGVPSDKTSTLTRKYFYQTPKDGSVKRCVSLPDDSVYITKPTLIPEVELMFPNEVGVASSFDQKQLMTHLRTSDLPTLQAVSRHFLAHQSNDTKTKCSNVDRSVPIALVHLMSGNVLSAIEQIGRAREAAVDSQVDPALLTVAGLAWEVVANHEDCQSRQILTAAFKCLPITTTQKRSSQLRRLWPMVWNELGVQERISVEEKLDLLQTWIAPTKNVTNVEIPGAALRSASNNSFPRVRVWARCNHVEPAVIGVASSDCNACAEEWTETVRTTLE
ncbi:hypothetical protein RB195_000355 [Necator americanus]|uniref:Regulator of condensation n=1 Tax=Necator americanus TaxID=51031 RepID=A0ABR1D987_NECAM